MQYQNILLIDDDIDDRQIFETVLMTVTHAIRFAAFDDAAIALQKLQTGEVSADIIFLDLNLPTMSAMEFMAEIKNDPCLKEMPLIILSSNCQPGMTDQLKQLGAREIHQKPDKYSALKEILQDTLFPAKKMV